MCSFRSVQPSVVATPPKLCTREPQPMEIGGNAQALRRLHPTVRRSEESAARIRRALTHTVAGSDRPGIADLHESAQARSFAMGKTKRHLPGRSSRRWGLPMSMGALGARLHLLPVGETRQPPLTTTRMTPFPSWEFTTAVAQKTNNRLRPVAETDDDPDPSGKPSKLPARDEPRMHQ